MTRTGPDRGSGPLTRGTRRRRDVQATARPDLGPPGRASSRPGPRGRPDCSAGVSTQGHGARHHLGGRLRHDRSTRAGPRRNRGPAGRNPPHPGPRASAEGPPDLRLARDGQLHPGLPGISRRVGPGRFSPAVPPGELRGLGRCHDLHPDRTRRRAVAGRVGVHQRGHRLQPGTLGGRDRPGQLHGHPHGRTGRSGDTALARRSCLRRWPCGHDHVAGAGRRFYGGSRGLPGRGRPFILHGGRSA